MFKVERSFYNPLRDHGYWSPSTASSNFCEEEYRISFYVAEFINTLSNLAYIYYAIYTPTISLPQLTGRSSTLKSKHRYPKRKTTWDLHTPALMCVGVTSAMFHMSMHSLPQWFDESSMYVLAASFIHSLLTTTYIRSPPGNVNGNGNSTSTPKGLTNGRSKSVSPAPPQPFNTLIIRRNQRQVAITLLVVLLSTSYISHVTGNLTIHGVTFGLLLVLSGVKLISLVFTYETPTQIRQANRTKLLGLKLVTPTQRAMLKSLGRAYFFLNLGFALWLVDCNPGWCAWLRDVRGGLVGRFGVLGVVFGFGTELHGWWHVFTARAAGEYIGLVRVLTGGK